MVKELNEASVLRAGRAEVGRARPQRWSGLDHMGSAEQRRRWPFFLRAGRWIFMESNSKIWLTAQGL